ncbi:MAG: hypothetical protein PV344_08695 [Anaplasma sp.]|nr:hypothetical protein [Anaplasma sp.]
MTKFSRISRIAYDLRKLGSANNSGNMSTHGSYIRFAKIRTRK